MKHARADYNRIQDPAGKIPANEPVLLFRGQDLLAPAVLRFYADLLDKNGVDAELARVVRNQAIEMEQWPQKKLPDLPQDMRAEIEALNERMPEHVLLISEPYHGGPLTEGKLPAGAQVTQLAAGEATLDSSNIPRLPVADEQDDKFPSRLSPEPTDPQGNVIKPLAVNDPNLFDKMMNKDKR
jgi:hypothetical protein